MGDSTKKNYYELLRVERTATQEEIKTAFKEVSLVYHPDSNYFDEILEDLGLPSEEVESSAEDVAIFQEITNAYHTLSNTEKRAKYDKDLAKKELASGMQSTNEWIRPDGSQSSSSTEAKSRERQPTVSDLQRLQKRYEERSKIKIKTVAEIIEEEEEINDIPVFYIAIGLLGVILLGILTAFLLF